jgi:hypothetical protein
MYMLFKYEDIVACFHNLCFTISTNTDALGPVLETPYMQAVQVVHADKNSFLGVKDREVSLCCFLKLRFPIDSI